MKAWGRFGVVAALFMVSSPWVWLLHVRVETRHVHAERHLAKAGVARRKGRGLPTEAKRRRPKAGLHKRSAEDWGSPLSPRDRGRAP